MSEAKGHRLSSEQWSDYWRSDSVTTFTRQFNANYDGEFAAFWNARFAATPSPARVVDLATGNGAIALLAAQYAHAQTRGFEIVGIDYADIDPAQALSTHTDLTPLLARIAFRSRVRIEDTGLEAASVDLLTSQYGFEYGDEDGAIAEARRVLKPGGRLALILHNDDSVVIELAKDGLAQVQFCLQKEELDKRVIALVKVVGEARTPEARRALKHNPKAERLRQKLNASLTRITQRAKQYRDPEGFIGIMVPNFTKVFGELKDATMPQKLKYVREVRAAFDAFRERMADLAGAALSAADFDRLVAKLEAIGFAIEQRDQMRYKGDLMGWALVARKPAG